MNCRDCQELLQKRLDGQNVPVSEELEHHLSECLACRQNQAAVQRLLEGLAGLVRVSPPDDLTRKIVAEVLHDRVRRQHRLRVRLAVTVALAASILFMAWAGNLWLPEHKKDKTPVGPGPSPVELQAERPLTESVDEVRSAVAALTDRLADQTKDQARLLIAAAAPVEIPPVNWTGLENFEEPLDPAKQSLRRTGQGVSQSLQTVSQNARRAVDYFFKEIPVLE